MQVRLVFDGDANDRNAEHQRRHGRPASWIEILSIKLLRIVAANPFATFPFDW